MNAAFTQAEELLSDEGFLSWYFKTDPGHQAAWDKLIAGDPNLKKLADEAVLLLQSIRLNEIQVDERRLQQAEQRLKKRINGYRLETGQPEAPVINLKKRSPKWWWSAAAVIILAAAGAVWQYTGGTRRSSLESKFGEVKQDVLPDGSEIQLNAGTRVTFEKGWENGKEREVWLDGEAFFKVKSTLQKSRFVVHTGNFDVIVTGTQFNVTHRLNKSNVMLKEGSVIIRPEKGDEIVMKPGEFVEFSNDQYQKKIVGDTTIAWKERKFIFEKTPIKEVAASVSEIYGIKVTLADDIDTSYPITCIYPNDNLDSFLNYLGQIGNVRIERQEKEIVISKK